MYLAAVLDLYWRKVVGWAMAPTMPAELVCGALQMAIVLRQANQAVVGLKAQDLDGPPEEVWVEPSRKRVQISFEDWKAW
ncbi:hypothetical protein [Xanthomonas citri]|uniref:hypothetical protein n=1 Tax=Xanthomonas citri TaxID=346 RepID=UPI001CBACE32|nr:hypothetical protein [Xanthomonas citri]